MFGVVYKQDYRAGHSDSEEKFSNVIFLKDAPFDTDIDTEFVRRKDHLIHFIV